MKIVTHLPAEGDIRIREIFLLLPRIEYNRKAKTADFRWLEWATVEEKYETDYEGFSGWGFVRFIEKDGK